MATAGSKEIGPGVLNFMLGKFLITKPTAGLSCKNRSTNVTTPGPTRDTDPATRGSAESTNAIAREIRARKSSKCDLPLESASEVLKLHVCASMRLLLDNSVSEYDLTYQKSS
jgi:hypothetical protein